MKKIVLYAIAVLCLVNLCFAGYDTNIGPFQADTAGSDYKVNIGADQTDEAAPPAAEAATGAQVVIISM